MKEDKWKDPYAFVQKGSDLLCTVYERRERKGPLCTRADRIEPLFYSVR